MKNMNSIDLIDQTSRIEAFGSLKAYVAYLDIPPEKSAGWSKKLSAVTNS